MPAYFASDVHLRLDYPERGRRFARWVDTLDPEDTLTIIGDLCDFWFAARQITAGASACAGLRALAALRARGGTISFLPGNHDVWLGPFYQRSFGAKLLEEPVYLESHGQRLCLVHGHLLGGRKPWKAWMESQTFLSAFGQTPKPVANLLDRLLEQSNARGRLADEEPRTLPERSISW